MYDAMRFATNKKNAFSNVSVVFKSINTTDNTSLLNQGTIFVCVYFSRFSRSNSRIPLAIGHKGHMTQYEDPFTCSAASFKQTVAYNSKKNNNNKIATHAHYKLRDLGKRDMFNSKDPMLYL